MKTKKKASKKKAVKRNSKGYDITKFKRVNLPRTKRTPPAKPKEILTWTSATGVITPINKLEHAHVFNIVVMLEHNARVAGWIVDTKIWKALVKRLKHFEPNIKVPKKPEEL